MAPLSFRAKQGNSFQAAVRCQTSKFLGLTKSVGPRNNTAVFFKTPLDYLHSKGEVMLSIRKSCGVLSLVLAMGCPGLFAKNPTVPPNILHVAPAGAQYGSTVDVIVEGQNLADVRRVLFSESGMKAEVVNVRQLPKKELVDDDGFVVPAMLYEAPSYRVTLKVSISSEVPLGIHSFRLLTPLGITERVSFAVGEWAEVKESSGMSGKVAWAELPATLIGTLETLGEVDEFQFYAREGQELVFQMTAATIGSALEPIVEVLDAQGHKVGSKSVAANRDVVLGITFTTEGRYTLRISDYEMRGGRDFYYRVTAGELPYVTRVFPLGVPKGKPTEVKLEGFNLAGVESVMVEPPASARLWDTFETWVTTPKGKSLNPIRLAVNEYPEILEKEIGSGLSQRHPCPDPRGYKRPNRWRPIPAAGRRGPIPGQGAQGTEDYSGSTSRPSRFTP